MRTAALTIAALLTAAPALAFPAVGDKNVYVGTYSAKEGGEVAFSQILELASYNAKTREFLLLNTFIIGTDGEKQTQEANSGIDTLMSPKRVKDILRDCSAGGGEAVTLTVPAGTYETCKVENQDGKNGTVWVADVPFGFVKEIYFDEGGNRIDVELQSSRAGD